MLYFAEPAGKISFEKFVKRLFMGIPADETAVSASLKAIEAFFDVVNGLLQRRKWMAGEQFTLVDIYYIPMILRLAACGYEDVVSTREAVAAWWHRVISRPAIEKLLAADREAAASARK
jgi:glutathione S-transferase